MNPLLAPTLTARIASSNAALAGLWVCSGSPVMAEICAGSGIDWLLIDAEHSPQSLAEMQVQLQAMAAYPVTAAIRVPSGDPVVLKQVLDLGVQNVIVPMISTAEQARAVVAATSYPPKGIRGIGSALARSGRWGRVSDYLQNADSYVSVTVQIETAEAVAKAADILAVEGVDAVFVGPSDLAASMGLIGQQSHPDVVAAVKSVFEAASVAGKPVGVNAFDPLVAQDYIDSGADFILVGSDVTLVARGSEALAKRFVTSGDTSGTGSGSSADLGTAPGSRLVPEVASY